MRQSRELVATLKRELKSRHYTYAHIAQALAMSEANVKRMFASGRFTLERVEAICDLLNMDFGDLVRANEAARSRVKYLTEEQEHELVSDIRLLLVAVCVSHHLSFDEIIQAYQISETECVSYLARMDRLRLIELLPTNRIRHLYAEGFRWLPKGPIEQFFESHVQTEFLQTDFSRAGQLRLFKMGRLSVESHELLLQKLEKLAAEFAELHHQDIRLAVGQKQHEALFLALRPWQFSAFDALRRE